jgi:pyrroloquinoline-quinone synthase
LPKESLKQYAKEYFHFEAMYPTFLSAVHSRCSDRKARQLLLDNLWDEEHGEENHVELWLRFCDALGLDREEVENNEAAQATKDLIDFFSVKA